MSHKTVETLAVKGLTKYGFQTDKGEFVNWSQKLAESERGKVVPGGSYELDLFVSDTGKKYVNAVRKQVQVAAPVVEKPVVKPTPKVEAKPVSPVKAEVDWAAKDRSQLIGGLSHDAAAIAAAIVNLAGMTNSGDALVVYQELLEGMIKIRDEVK